MSQSLKVLPELMGKVLTIKLSGAIDENSDYSQIQTEGLERLVINLRDIKMINSIGIQKWVKFFEGLGDSLAIQFVECNGRVVNQINQFSGFTGGKTVVIESVLAPYFCEDCDEEAEVLVQCGDVEMSGEKPAPPQQDCPSCKQSMEFDAVARKYFSFLLEDK